MNFAFQIAVLLGLLAVCCFTPGFFVVRRLRLGPVEKLCASIGLSVILLYLDTWIVFLVAGGAGSQLPSTPFWISSAVCIALGLAAWKDMLKLFRSFRVKHALGGFGFLLIWTLVILGMIRVYSGGTWSGDWQEHFQRTLFFLQGLPTNTAFAGVYSLPARPPMVNVLATYFLAQTQDRFELFQVVLSFLNLFAFLACCLLLPAVAGARRTRILPLVLLFALNPVFMQNVTYSWTRALTALFLISGIAFYLSAWRKSDNLRMVAAFVLLAAGLLAHYSAGPYVVFLTLHYMLRLFWKRPNKFREIALIAASCIVLLATWLAWSLVIYGKATLRPSNSTVTFVEQPEGSSAVRFAANLFDSIIPALARDPSLMSTLEQPNTLGLIRDYAFLSYQPNLVFALGLVGGPVVVWLAFRRLRTKSRKGAEERNFWSAFIIVSIILGALVVGSREPLGVAHGTMLSLELVGLTFLASRIQTRRTLTFLVLAGCLADFSLGVLLHAHVQSMENDSGKSYFAQLVFTNEPNPACGPRTRHVIERRVAKLV